jgi:Fe-S-cluster containining protein
VPIDGFDLVRLVRAVGGAWQDLVELECVRHPLYFGFRLDAGYEHWSLWLKRHDDGACRFLVGDDGARRCGVYDARPGACRSYPAALDDGRPMFSGHAICPPERAAGWIRVLERDDAVYEDLAERELYLRALSRWDRGLLTGAARSADEFVRWIGALDDALRPLRRGERGGWQLAAYARIDEFPLP